MHFTYSSHEFGERPSEPAAQARAEVERQALDEDGVLLPHYRTFQSLYNLFSKTYSTRWDEAVRHGHENAAAMKNDTYFRALMAERLDPLGLWDWTVQADADPVNPKDPHRKDKEQVARMLEAECRATPDLMKFRRHLGWSAWFGRVGNQVAYVRDPESGLDWSPWVPRVWAPVDGDKLHWSWADGGHWTVLINGAHRGDYPPDETGVNDRTTFLRLRRADYRQRFVIATHEIEDAPYEDALGAGRSKGVGLRDFVHWGWWLRDELLSWMVSLAEKAGTLGLLMFKYPAGNKTAQEQAEANAKAVNNRNALTVPVHPNTKPDDYGVEVVALPTEGLRFLKEVTFDYFDKHFERLFIGQTLSSGTEGSGLGGSGVADMHQDTKFARLKFDARNQEECLTTDFVKVLKRLNHADAPGVYRWKYLLPDPKAKDKLEAITKAASLPGAKLSYKADEVRDLVGMGKPEEGDEVIGGEEPAAPEQEGDPANPDRPKPMAGSTPAEYAFNPNQKRGQPGNAGQFGPGGGGKAKPDTAASKATAKKAKVKSFTDLIHGGHADHESQLARLPEGLHAAVLDAGLTAIYLGTGPVTGLDDMGHLKGQTPKGWPAGSTWESVRGCYDRTRKAVICGTGTGGSTNVTLHEYGHAAADLTGLEQDPAAGEWHKALFANLALYFQQDGPGGESGVQELLAESFAIYWSDGEAELAKFARSREYARWFGGKMKELSDGSSRTA